MKLVTLMTVAVVVGGGIAVAQTTAPGTMPPSTTTPGTMPSPSPTMPAPTTPSPTTPPMATPPAPTPAPSTTAPTKAPPADALVPGANSFTEGQARDRIEKAGYTDVGTLTKSEDGIWRGSAKKNGTAVTVGVDFKGNVTTR